MRIAIDFDDVIVHTIDEILKGVNKRSHGGYHEWTVNDVTHWGLSQITGLSQETIWECINAVDYSIVLEVQDAVGAIQQLQREGNDVHILTANPNKGKIRTWLDYNGLEDVDMTSTSDKVTWMLNSEFDTIIDDRPATLKTASNAGLRAIRFERNWNNTMSGWGGAEYQISVTSWFEILQVIRTWNDQEARKQLADALGIIGMPERIITNAFGAKQSDIEARYDLLPTRALNAVAKVLHTGAEKYGEDNWRGLSETEILNHALAHGLNFLHTGSHEDAEHFACRALMFLEILKGGGADGGQHPTKNTGKAEGN
jgi:uncharacterized HAD superfamily protein